MNLSDAEIQELQTIFSDLNNYEDEDPLAPIEPLTYRSSDGDTCLHVAARRGSLRAVQLLLKGGLDVNALGDMSYTPLHLAATTEIVDVLLENGADPNIKNEFGRSPVGSFQS